MKFCRSRIEMPVGSKQISFGLSVIRVFLGLAFMIHGFGKIQNPMGWMGPDAPYPQFLLALAATAEFFGGLGMALGLFTSLASLGIMATMSVAIAHHMSRGDGFAGGYELAMAYWVLAFFFLVVGPGRFSLDQLCSRKCQEKRSKQK